jgi:Asp-tRNA(Asn)/Glu-tRNA(Gln) amidotransferase C subunit
MTFAPEDVAFLREKGFTQTADEIERLIEALREIAGFHVPDQPMTSEADEATWVRQHVAKLRKIAVDAIR